jgi:hypothetical protein
MKSVHLHSHHDANAFLSFTKFPMVIGLTAFVMALKNKLEWKTKATKRQTPDYGQNLFAWLISYG